MELYAQTMPSLFNLSTGNYSMTQWDNTNLAGTYPANMYFHQGSAADPFLTTEPNADYTAAYNLSSGVRLRGLGTAGFSFLNTSGGMLGAAVLGLNTSGRVNITVGFVGGTVATAQRDYRIRLQYRIGVGSWIDVPGPIEYLMNVTTGHTQTFSGVVLPVQCENQAVLYLRWKYYYTSPTTGTRPDLSVDEISVSSSSNIGVPTKFAITSITPTTPSSNTGFSALVQAVDGTGSPRIVAATTTFSLSVFTGTGTLSGTITGTILAGNSNVNVTGVIYSIAENNVRIAATRTSGELLTQGVSGFFNVQQSATQVVLGTNTQSGFVRAFLGLITGEARKPDFSLDPNYVSTFTMTKVSGPGILSGLTTRIPVGGVARFDSVFVDLPGTYVFQVTAPGLTSANTQNIVIRVLPTMTPVLTPQFMRSATSVQRLPAFALVTFTNLQPASTYRYISGIATTPPVNGINGLPAIPSGAGAGFNINQDANANSYAFTTSKSIITVGVHSFFSTGPAETSKSVWVNVVSSTNTNFNNGNLLNWVVSLADQYGNVISRYPSVQQSTAIEFGSAITNATGIVDVNSGMKSKNMVVLYSEVAGVTQPLSIAIVQDDGTNISPSVFFYQNLEAAAGSWATLIPNSLATGVRRIEERDGRTGAIVRTITDADGIWGATNTADPTGGTSALSFETPTIIVTGPFEYEKFCVSGSKSIEWWARGVVNVKVELSTNNGTIWTLLTNSNPATPGKLDWLPDAPGGNEYRIRVTDVDRPTVLGVGGIFAGYYPPNILQEPADIVRCVNEDASFLVIASGDGTRFQWQKDGVDLPNQTSQSLIIRNVVANTSGRYRCIVSSIHGACVNDTSLGAHLFIAPPTQVYNSTKIFSAPSGTDAIIQIESNVPNNLNTFQWRKGNTALSDGAKYQGTNSSILTIQSVTTADQGTDYNCIVVGPCGLDTTDNLALFIPNLTITSQPTSVVACLGGTATVSVSVQTNPAGQPIEYQWYKNGTRLSNTSTYSGVNTAMLTIMNTTTGDAGTYTVNCILSGTAAMVNSTPIVVTASGPPVITDNPANLSICTRNRIALGTKASGNGTLQYRWIKNGNSVAGQTRDSLKITSAVTGDAGKYRCIVSNECGVDTTDEVTIDIKQNVSMQTQPPRTITAAIGSQLSIDLVAAGGGTIRYAWYHDGALVPSQTTAAYRKNSVVTADAGKYWCIVGGDCNSITSDTVRVTVGSTGVSGYETVGEGLVIRQNTPNPMTDRTVFEYSVSSFEPALTLSVTDLLGRAIHSHSVADVSAGNHKFEFNSNLENGVYNLTLSNGQKSISRQFVVSK